MKGIVMENKDWRHSVTVVRKNEIDRKLDELTAAGRATAFEFVGSRGSPTWIGFATLTPKERTNAHNHGRHELGVYVAKGRGEIRWGERLEFAAGISPGDFIYFAPFVPHQELNLDEKESLDLVVVRSDKERIAEDMEVAAVQQPQCVY